MENEEVQTEVVQLGRSPAPPVAQREQVELSFPDAIREVLNGFRIKRLAWDTMGGEHDYGLLCDGFLCIFIKGEPHKWTVNDGDLNATDWVVIQEKN